MKKVIAKVFALGDEQFEPIVAAAARTLLCVGGAAAIGVALDGLNTVDWKSYLGEDGTPYALMVVAALRLGLEGLLDQLKKMNR